MSKSPGGAKQDENGRVQYSFYLGADLYQRAVGFSKRRMMSMASLLRDALSEYLANHE